MVLRANPRTQKPSETVTFGDDFVKVYNAIAGEVTKNETQTSRRSTLTNPYDLTLTYVIHITFCFSNMNGMSCKMAFGLGCCVRWEQAARSPRGPSAPSIFHVVPEKNKAFYEERPRRSINARTR